MEIILYSTPSCGKCMLTESLLKDRIYYQSIKDTSLVIEKANELDNLEMPILQIDNSYFQGIKAVKKAKELVENING